MSLHLFYSGPSTSRTRRNSRGHARIRRPAATSRPTRQDRLQEARPHRRHIAHVPHIGWPHTDRRGLRCLIVDPIGWCEDSLCSAVAHLNTG